MVLHEGSSPPDESRSRLPHGLRAALSGTGGRTQEECDVDELAIDQRRPPTWRARRRTRRLATGIRPSAALACAEAYPDC